MTRAPKAYASQFLEARRGQRHLSMGVESFYGEGAKYDMSDVSPNGSLPT